MTSLETETQNSQTTNQVGNYKDEQSIDKLKISFAPQFLAINPYQKQLIEHLEKLGVQAQGISPKVIFLPRLTKQWNPKILHLHWLHKFFDAPDQSRALLKLSKFIIGLFTLKLQGIKLVWTAHNLKNHENRYPSLDNLCTYIVAKTADKIIAHSQLAKDEIAKQLKLKDTDKIRVIPHGHYIDYYENVVTQKEARKILNLPDSSVVLLFFGLVRPYKGVLELIDAFERLNADALHLVVAGKPLNEQFLELIEQKRTANRNISLFLEFIPDEQVQIYMNACDLVAFPYREFLTSGAVLLAMSFGRVCIAPRKGCMAELLDSSGAFLYDPDTQDGLLLAIEAAIQKKNDLPMMGLHNRQVAEQLNWSQIAEMTLSVYREALGS